MPEDVFVSQKCSHSMRFLKLIEKYWKHNDFEYVILEEHDPKEFPKYITKLPSVMTVDSESGGSMIYEGDYAFQWLYESVKSLYAGSRIKIEDEETAGPPVRSSKNVTYDEPEDDPTQFPTKKDAIPKHASVQGLGAPASAFMENNDRKQEDIAAEFEARMNEYKEAADALPRA